MTKNNQLLIQFAKAPVPGQVKTRLIPELGAEHACQLHWAMTSDIVNRLNSQSRQAHWDYELHVDDIDHNQVLTLANDLKVKCVAQIHDDLGGRMQYAIKTGLEHYHKVAIIGSDCLFINHMMLKELFDSLANHDVAFIPATDGGYAAIAVNSICAQLFHDMPWGTENVYEINKQRCALNGIRYYESSPVRDIDRYEDLIACKDQAVIKRFILPEDE